MITTAQINEPDYVEFSAQADPAIGPRLSLAISTANGAATTIVAALDLAPGKRSGRHTHSVEEVVLVLKGTAEMTVGDEQVRLSVGEMVLVPALAPHELSNAGSEELRTVAFFPNAAFVSIFDEILSPVGSRVLITPPPDADSAGIPIETAETSA
ncbi:MAG: cupin domain-containing protein [Actinomycetota bacterium]|nr:cupin domain-containing protein [Actinomycetota bacterium]